MGMKRGRLSNEEARYITENANSISVEEIGTYTFLEQLNEA